MTITGRRGFDVNHPHGSIYYGVGDSALNAAPYALAGEPASQPGYLQNNFGGSIGGPLNIPKIYHGGTKTFFFVNYNGKRGENPFDQFSTVPTLLERQGNFSQATYTSGEQAGLPVEIFDPTTDAPFPCNPTCNTLPQVNSVAQGLLQYIPTPNLPGDYRNFHFVTSTTNDNDDLNVRINHTFGTPPSGGRRGGRGGPRNNLTFGFHYHGSDSNITNPFPSVGGSTNGRSFDVPIAWVKSVGKLTNSLRFDFNRSRTRTQNLYAFNDDIDSGLGITGVSTNPFDWGLPSLSFSNFNGLSDVNPQLLRYQTYTFSDYIVWTHGKHSWRWGGDFRRIQRNTETSSNARGAFTFTGYNTSEIVGGQQVLGTGYDFADFLLGLPQTTSVQFGEDNYHFHGNYYDLYAQDEWKLRGNLTLNLGVRYEYVSPLTEENNLLANLALSPGVLNPALGTPTVDVVCPGTRPSCSAFQPASLVRPDRKAFAPRVGFAWKPFSKTVVRGGYGINYNTGAYQTIVQQLAFQPPFSTAETNIQTAPGELTLTSGFPAPAQGVTTNSYAVNPNYRFGYVQIRNLDIQQQLRPTLLLNIDYTGTKGTNLDILEAPNRTISAAKGFRSGFPMCRRLPMRTRWATPRLTRDRSGCASACRMDSPSEARTHIPSRLTMRLRLAQEPLRPRAQAVWARAAPAQPEEVRLLLPAAERTVLRRIRLIFRRSEVSPALTRRTASPRIICGSFPLAATGAGWPTILRCRRSSATGSGAETGPLRRGFPSLRATWPRPARSTAERMELCGPM